MSLLKEIRNQPDNIRETFMWVSVVIVFSFVIFGWFRSTEDKLFVMLHPEEAEQERALAENAKQNQPSLFSTIGSTIGELKGSLTGFIGGGEDLFSPNLNNQQEISPQKLPVVE